MTPDWLSAQALHQGGPKGLVKATERILWHLGFDDVRVIDGPGDHGADILAVRANQQWVLQCKWSNSGPINSSGVEELWNAYSTYSADEGAIVSNTELTRPAAARVKELEGIGARLNVWNGSTLAGLGSGMPEFVPSGIKPHRYQVRARDKMRHDLEERGSALLMLATGLGKTVVGGEVIKDFLGEAPTAKILVVSHLKELSAQLERALWQHLPKGTPTHLLTGDEKPVSLEGLTAGTIESVLNAVHDGYRPNLVMIDEAHHVGHAGRYRELLQMLEGVPFFGVTATPWRGDEFDLSLVFGQPSFALGIAEGMKQGFLSNVDYRLFVDNFNWDLIREQSRNGYSIKELNSKLFLPQRDLEIMNLFHQAWSETHRPRGHCLLPNN